MSDKQTPNVRERLEASLFVYPQIFSIISAFTFAAILCGTGIAVGAIQANLLLALVLAIGGAIVGGLVGWMLSDAILFVIFVIVAVLYPKSKWDLPLAVLGGLAAVIDQYLRRKIDSLLDGSLVFVVFFVISLVLIHIFMSGISLFEHKR